MHVPARAPSQTTREQQAHIHAAWVRRTEEVKLRLGPQLSGIMFTMFGTLCVNSVVFISIFNGVNNLMVSKVRVLLGEGSTLAWASK